MWRSAVALPLLLALSGCAAFGRSATGQLAESLSASILNQDDVGTVRDGAPAYLLGIDTLIVDDPKNPEILLTGAQLYTAYASAFVEEEARARRLSDRSLGYARRALCIVSAGLCAAAERPYPEFLDAVSHAGHSDLAVLYGFGAAWAGWVQAHAGDWGALAELPKIEALMARVVELDEAYEHAGAHLTLGVLLSQRPASLGGQPEAARVHFERAVALTEGRNLMAKVLYARHYARLVFDRALHDRLLDEVIAADPRAPGLTLSNTLAVENAHELLDDADDYF
jgi:hypothetical protein